jgi:predicted nucleic acid-binding protein
MVRKTLGCLIAAPCIRTGSSLLHADRDFDLLASCTDLEIFG